LIRHHEHCRAQQLPGFDDAGEARRATCSTTVTGACGSIQFAHLSRGLGLTVQDIPIVRAGTAHELGPAVAKGAS